MNTERIVFLDMDGVCCGFVEAVGDLFDIKDIMNKITPGKWDFYEDLGITKKELWDTIREAGESFWFSMEELPSHDILYDNLRKLAKVYYVTTPELTVAASWSGKLRWIRKRRGGDFKNIIMCKDKSLLAGPNRVLIDDKPDNVKWFSYFGGYGIMFPQRCNSTERNLMPLRVRAYNVIKAVELHYGVIGGEPMQTELNLYDTRTED